MSDFLAAIAARATGAEPGIAPRQPARFEPDAIDAPRSLVETPVDNAPAQDARPDVTGEARPPQPDVPRPAPDRYPPQFVLDEAPEPIPAAGEPARRDAPLPGGPATWDTPLLAPPDASLPSARSGTPPAPAPDSSPTARLIDPPPVPGREPIVTPDRPVTQPEPVIATGPRGDASPPASIPETRRAAQQQQIVPRADVTTTIQRQQPEQGHDGTPVATRIRPLPVSEPGGPMERAPEPPSPPAIHVTIGRVEVRARAAPAGEGRRPRGNPAVLPLTEYLRQRKGGA